jgi:hypothetical protein
MAAALILFFVVAGVGAEIDRHTCNGSNPPPAYVAECPAKK